jgi:integrase
VPEVEGASQRTGESTSSLPPAVRRRRCPADPGSRLRHLAATLMISSQVPLAMASKTLRHSKLSITVDTDGHLMPYATQQAVDAIADALAAAELSRSDA